MFNNVQTNKSRNICILGSKMVLDGPGSKNVLVAFVIGNTKYLGPECANKKSGNCESKPYISVNATNTFH